MIKAPPFLFSWWLPSLILLFHSLSSFSSITTSRPTSHSWFSVTFLSPSGCSLWHASNTFPSQAKSYQVTNFTSCSFGSLLHWQSVSVFRLFSFKSFSTLRPITLWGRFGRPVVWTQGKVYFCPPLLAHLAPSFPRTAALYVNRCLMGMMGLERRGQGKPLVVLGIYSQWYYWGSICDDYVSCEIGFQLKNDF